MKTPIKGVADNRSYKDEYHFHDDKYDISAEQPSIEKDPKVNTTIKENPYRSNVEIEGGEIVLQPDLSALFKAKGKRHSKGGMDVLLRPDSFIFSDFKDLEFDEDDLELFELKEGGKSNTPAEVLKKNIDVKHYNKLVTILDDPYKDDLAKKSAAMMLEKYIQTLGNIAYRQEELKDFPQGLPEFSIGTAPVYDSGIKDQIEENKQYMKAGGTINNPYQNGGMVWDIKTGRFVQRQPPRAAGPVPGPWVPPTPAVTPQQPGYFDVTTGSYTDTNPYGPAPTTGSTQSQVQNNVTSPQQKTPKNPIPWGLWQGDQLPVFQDRYGVTNAADKFDKLKNWDAIAQQLGYTGPKDNLQFQRWLYASSPENKAIIDKWHNTYNQGPTAGMFDQKIGIRWANAINDIISRPKPSGGPECPCGIDRTGQCIPCDEPKPKSEPPIVPGPQVPTVDAPPQGSKQADWRFTPWQKISQLWNWGNYANVKRYMPYRSRYNATYVDPALVNPEQAVGDLKGVANQQLSSLGTLNPILRNAQAASVVGQVMNQAPGVRSQYDNQNAQILNQTRQYNNQVRNNESLVNLGFDQQYYREAIEGRKNFDNMRTYTANNAMNNVLRDVETNQKLAYNLLTQDQPAYGFDWNSGNFYRNPKSILDVQSNAVNERYSDIIEMINSISDPLEKAKLRVKIEGLKTFGSARSTAPQFKKGGRKQNPYR
jgi:hypothetical protein